MKQRILDTCLADGQLAMFSLGQEGFIFKFEGQYILIDGYLTDYVDRVAEADKGRKRNFPPPIRPEELDFVDWVFCTHEHADHMDPETLTGIRTCNRKARFVIPEPLIHVLTGLGIP